jgi:LysM repeat protein
MPDHGRRSPARILAPLALGAFALVFVAIVLSSGSGGGGGGESTDAGSRTAGTSTAPKRERTTTQPKKQAATYTVKVGDTLGSIAETTGVPVEKLLELNPDLDPQALVSGQKIKLRE